MTIVVGLALATAAAGCVNDSPKKPPKDRPRSSAVAKCAGYECRVRVTCKGRVSYRFGPAPVRIRTRKSALRTTIYADFAGSRDDAKIRC